MRNMNARWRWRLTYSGFLDTLQRSTIRPYEFSICQNGAWILEPCVNMGMDMDMDMGMGMGMDMGMGMSMGMGMG